MENEATEHAANTADDLWSQVESTLDVQCNTHDHIDDALRSYIALLQAHREEYIISDDDLNHCAYLLYSSTLFAQHAAYIRQQLIYCLLEEDDIHTLRVAVTFLLAEARENESTYELLNREAAFPRLVKLIGHPQKHEESMHRDLMELLYEMARMQKITNDDLSCISDEFICSLFDIIEQVSDDVNDPYHYPVIRVLLVLNEQFMVAAHDPAVLAKKSTPLTNKVVKVLSAYESRYKTFGANIILLLNREDETSLQLLTLKLMYLLFTTPPTYEYFYTNDLRVLVDILIRNLLDLPEYAAALRHTYLRVLYPLLEHTQLQRPPYYKRTEIRKLLSLLCGDRTEAEGTTPDVKAILNHFEAVDETTKRLVRRCQTVSWLSDPETSELAHVESPVEEKPPLFPESPSKLQPPELPAPRKLKKRDSSKASTLTIGQFLTPHLETARQSSLSMVEMATHKEKPGVITPSRNPSVKHGLRQAVFSKKPKPPPPKARRSGFMRPKPQSAATEMEITRVGAPGQMFTHEPQEHEVDVFEDAEEFPSQVEDSAEAEMTSPTSEAGSVSAQAEEQARAGKNPPPVPKGRRSWRKRKSRDNVEEGKPPGRFSARLPSLETKAGPFSSPEDSIPESSPFSPVKEKTLDPLAKTATMSPGTATPPEKRSVRTAVHQAQEIAIHEVEQCLEHTHLNIHVTTSPEQSQHNGHPQPSQGSEQPRVTLNGESIPLQRTILAPPGQAPIRAVPGPRMEVERSPFLSDDEISQNPESTNPSRKPSGADEADGLGLSRKDSWEDFGD